jgi:glycosyltransferase involved in cell wall biosynthesis
MRYAWDLQHQYLAESGLTRGLKGGLARLILHYMRLWDSRTAHGVDHFVANSRFIARRIRKAYGREASVIYPPVDTEAFTPGEQKADFYLAAGRMVPYKRMPAIVEAFAAMPDKRLVVIGDGPEFARVKALAGPNVQLMGYQPFETLREHMQRARAFVFAAEEDFGIMPVEAQACGTPVIAYGRGGATESVVGPGRDAPPTGLFFAEQTPQAIAAAVQAFEALPMPIAPADCARNAARFSQATFRAAFAERVRQALQDAAQDGGPDVAQDVMQDVVQDAAEEAAHDAPQQARPPRR